MCKYFGKKHKKNFAKCHKFYNFADHNLTYNLYRQNMNLLQAYTPYGAQSYGMFYVVMILVAVIFFIVVYRWLCGRLGLEANNSSVKQFKELAKDMVEKDYKIWMYRPSNRTYSYLQEDGSFGKPVNPVEFLQPFNHEDFETMRSEIFAICDGKRKSAKVTLRSQSAIGPVVRHYEMNISVARKQKGQPSLLLGIQHDITDDYRRQQTVSQLLLRYQTVFNSALVDMIYYDKEGRLTDINERACKAFNVPSRDFAIHGNFLLENNPIYNKIPLEQMQNTRTSCIIDFGAAEYADEKYKLDELDLKDRKVFYESTINPIRNAQGELEGVFMVGRDISEMVESYHRQQYGNRQLRNATKSIRKYLSDINYALRVSDVRIVNYYPKSYSMEISNNFGNVEKPLHLSQLRCIRLATLRFRRTVNSVLNRMDRLSPYPIMQSIETEIRDKQGRQIWLFFNLVPIRDAKGNIDHYFGMCRPITEMIETEQRLAVETKKAQETELVKQAFLTNMSYEIRTPLNTVIGFAELFAAEHDEADEPFFSEQIKESTQSLLLLVNDILYISKLDANMVEYKWEDCDFALSFEGFCQLGFSNIPTGIDTIIGKPFSHLVVNIDEQQVGDVVKRLCYIATMMTAKGTITANYEYHHGHLIISIEDTGKGITKELLPHVFERFIHDENNEMCGSGLDLPIVQALVQQMGGKIDIESEKGKGTTVWVSIPCEAKTIERRRENNTNPSEATEL